MFFEIVLNSQHKFHKIFDSLMIPVYATNYIHIIFLKN